MKIGIIGSGDIGGNLGRHFARVGHQVMFSSRHPDQLHDLAEEAGEKASVGTIEEAADFGDVIILAIPFKAIEEVANKIGPLDRKTIIETTNPYPQRDGQMAQDVRDSDRAASEFVADLFPQAHVIKAFNTIYFEHLRDHAFRPDEDLRAIPYAGDHKPSRSIAKQLIDEIGFVGLYVGTLVESHPMDVEQALYNKDLTIEEAQKILKNI